MRDTTQAAEQVRAEAIRRLEPGLRLRQAFELSESVRSLAVSRLREWHPERTDLELVIDPNPVRLRSLVQRVEGQAVSCGGAS